MGGGGLHRHGNGNNSSPCMYNVNSKLHIQCTLCITGTLQSLWFYRLTTWENRKLWFSLSNLNTAVAALFFGLLGFVAAAGSAINNDCVFPADTDLQKAVWQASLIYYYYKLLRSVCIKCANCVAIVSIHRHCQWSDGPSCFNLKRCLNWTQTLWKRRADKCSENQHTNSAANLAITNLSRSGNLGPAG